MMMMMITSVGRIELVFGVHYLPIPHCVVRKFIWYLLKLGYFPLELCPKLRKFRHFKSIALSTKLVVVILSIF